MIIDLNRFIAEETPYWTELEQTLSRLENDAAFRLDATGVLRFHYLYQRASAGLSRIMNFSAEKDIRVYLESLVARSFAEIHESREKSGKRSIRSMVVWFTETFPQTVRKRIAALWLALAVTLAGCAFGGLAVTFDPSAKQALMPFSHLSGSPADRVAWEEHAQKDRMAGHKSSFSSQLIANNTRVSFVALALGMTWGIGTLIILFSNGVMLGAVVADYVLAGQGTFLTGWLLPHGSIEIPSIILAGQAGFVLAGALIGWGDSTGIRARFRTVSGDLVVLIGGVAVLLVWAGFVEAFLSQYHQPVIPYSLKIGFGCVELVALILFIAFGGKKNETMKRIKTIKGE
jgi:uncharacterized membrane protein SpoIIM required for sporulation